MSHFNTSRRVTCLGTKLLESGDLSYEKNKPIIELDQIEFIRLIEKIRNSGAYSSRLEPNPHYDPKPVLITLPVSIAHMYSGSRIRIEVNDRMKAMKRICIFEWRLTILGNDLMLTKSDNGILPPHMDEYRLIGADWWLTFVWDGSSDTDRYEESKRVSGLGGYGRVTELKFKNYEGFKSFWMMAKMFAETDFDI